MERARDKTLWLLERVPEAMLKVRVHDFYSPVGWHFGHIGMTEEYWVCTQALRRPCLDDALSFLFRERGIPSYGINPFALEPQDLLGIHGEDEHIPLRELDRGVERLRKVLELWSRDSA